MAIRMRKARQVLDDQYDVYDVIKSACTGVFQTAKLNL